MDVRRSAHTARDVTSRQLALSSKVKARIAADESLRRAGSKGISVGGRLDTSAASTL